MRTGEGHEHDFAEERDAGEEEARGALLFAVHAEGGDVVDDLGVIGIVGVCGRVGGRVVGGGVVDVIDGMADGLEHGGGGGVVGRHGGIVDVGSREYVTG